MSNETIAVTVVITDLTTDRVTSIAELPEHLHGWGHDFVAQWAVDRDDATFGRTAVIDENSECTYYGTDERSYVMHYRAGARYAVTLGVCYMVPTYRITFPDGDSLEFRTEDMAVTMAGSIEGSILGTGTMVL